MQLSMTQKMSKERVLEVLHAIRVLPDNATHDSLRVGLE